MNDDKTKIAFRKLLDGEKLNTQDKVALENNREDNSRFRKWGVKIIKSWWAWIITLISTGAFFRDSIEAAIGQ